MPDQIAAQQFQLLRARIEAEMPAPACITVTSACERDGKSVTASGLAEHLAGAGYRTLIVDASSSKTKKRLTVAAPSSAATVETVLKQVSHTTVQKLDALGLAQEFAAGASAETVRGLVRAFRDVYDYTLIDASRLLEGNLALLFAAASDGTLLSIRRGRGAAAADSEMIRVLDSGHTKILGVVTASPAAIRDHSRRIVRSAPVVSRAHEDGIAPAVMSAVRSG